MTTKQWLWLFGTLGVAGIIGLFIYKKKAPPAVAVPVGVEVPTTCREMAISEAMRQLGLPREELTVRSLRSADLGLATWSMNLATANAWNTTVNTNVADNRFICITGVSYAGSAAETVRVNAAGSQVAWFSIEQVPGITTTHHVDIRPILVEQNEPIRIEVYASAVSATDNVILEGVVVEKRGLVLA